MFHLFSRKWIRTRLLGHRTLLLMLELFLVLIVTGVLFVVTLKYVEGMDWMESVWQVWQTATTVGYGNQPAETPVGRLSTMFFGLVTIGILGTTISTLFDYREEQRSKRRYGMMDNPYKDGIVIFNFPGVSRFLDFERELRENDPGVGICFVDNKLEELPQEVSLLPKIHFIRSSIIEEATYQKAGLKDNRVVVVFPADPTNPESDATTKVVLDFVRGFAGDEIRVIYVMVDQRNEWMFKDINATPILDSLEILALVQECEDPYTVSSIQLLLVNTTEKANPVTVKADLIHGMTWGELVERSLPVTRSMGITINFFSLIKNHRANPCPDYDTPIHRGDFLSIIARESLNWTEIERAIVKYGESEAKAS